MDLNYTAHEDEYRMYRALRLVKPVPSLSGQYKCKVSSLFDEDFKQKNMIIYGKIYQLYLLTINFIHITSSTIFKLD